MRRHLFPDGDLALDDYGYVARRTRTSIPAAPSCPGCSSPARPPAPRTSRIPSCTPARRSRRQPRTWKARSEGASDERAAKIGVYVCQCGGNISDYVDVEKVVAEVRATPDVVVARTAMFTCSDATQQEIVQDIQEQHLDGLVVASCSPKLHTFTFRDVAKRAGLNPYQYTQVNIREQCSWTHTDDKPAPRTRPRAWCAPASTARVSPSRSSRSSCETEAKSLVIGGGIAGLRAALGLAEIGLAVFLVEKEPRLGGWVAGFGDMYPNGRNGAELIATLEAKVRRQPGHHRVHGRRGRGQERQLRQLRGRPSP